MNELRFEDFEHYFPFAPTALCIKECARLTSLREYTCKGPILDVGCGDGLFAKVAYAGEEVWGIDIDANEGRLAQASRAYSQIILGDITQAKLAEDFFETCIANCSLEHVPDIDGALKNILKSLKPGGRALLFVPNREWAEWFISTRAMRALKANVVGDMIERSINRIFKHHHIYDEAGWRRIMENAGFEVEAVDPVGSTGSTVAFELFLVPSLLGLVNKKLTTRWTNFPPFRKALAPIAFGLVEASLALANDSSKTAEYLLVGRKPLAKAPSEPAARTDAQAAKVPPAKPAGSPSKKGKSKGSRGR
jgi:SAM-dependent methyltransferase